LTVVRPPVKRAAVLVAHPDDEILWAGGMILSHPDWDWFIATLCRAGDRDRAPKFHRVLTALQARGAMADLDDGPDQDPLPMSLVRDTLLALLPNHEYDLILTHDLHGEYTRHLRHEETSRAVLGLWLEGLLSAGRVRLFAYADSGRETLSLARPEADCLVRLDELTWQRKYQLITQTYGFTPASWEARTTPRIEAFWELNSPGDLRRFGWPEDLPD
jgi:hypothetical protein